MRALLAASLLILTLAAARAESISGVADADRVEIQQTITAQIDAFRHDDAGGAFKLASPDIQAMFGDKEHFMAMVRQGYQPVYNPRAVRFDDLVLMDGHIVQRVALVGPDGLAALALYTMEREPDGSWRINGCQLTKSDDVNT